MFRFSLILFLYWSHVGYLCGQSAKPRGASPDLYPMYDAQRNFQCLDSGEVLPFSRVNDDYCDCQDGSDEPGTSACANGKFYCENAGYRPFILPSSRVNDGICDCCDGSDEWDHDAGVEPCPNNCMQVGAAARAEHERKLKVVEAGLAIKAQMAREGTENKIKKESEVKEKQSLKTEAESSRTHLEEAKNKAEALEKEALDVYRAEEEAQRLKEEEAKKEIEKAEMEAAFAKLDVNGDGLVDLSDMIQFLKFDQNNDGIVSNEEANFYLSGFEAYNLDDFKESGWTLIKPAFNGERTATTTTPSPTENNDNLPDYDDEDFGDDGDLDVRPPKPKPTSSLEEIEENEGYDDEEDDEEDDPYNVSELNEDSEAPSTTTTTSTTDEENKAKYDPETQRLIEAADSARSAYNEADRLVRDLEREIQDLNNDIGKDYGPNNEFFPIAGQCFEFTDNEYNYKMCAFDHCAQQGKHGGTETRLGNFEGWNENRTSMRYKNGVQCWNGPARSTNVIVQCGAENKLVSTSEPNKCEYEFVFETPAACAPISTSPYRSGHDEL